MTHPGVGTASSTSRFRSVLSRLGISQESKKMAQKLQEGPWYDHAPKGRPVETQLQARRWDRAQSLQRETNKKEQKRTDQQERTWAGRRNHSYESRSTTRSRAKPNTNSRAPISPEDGNRSTPAITDEGCPNRIITSFKATTSFKLEFNRNKGCQNNLGDNSITRTVPIKVLPKARAHLSMIFHPSNVPRLSKRHPEDKGIILSPSSSNTSTLLMTRIPTKRRTQVEQKPPRIRN